MNKLFFTFLFFMSFIFLSSVVNAEIQILTAEEPPTNYEVNGKIIGTTVDIVERIKIELDIKTDIKMMPWARVVKTVTENPDVVIFTCGRTPERIEHGFHFVGPVITRKHALFKKKGSSLSIKNIEDIKKQGLTIGAMRGDWREKFFIDQGVKVDNVTEYGQNIDKLLKGRFDLMISSDIEIPPILDKKKLPLDSVEIVFVFKEAPSFIMISKDTPKETVEKWQKAFESLQGTNFFKETADKYSKILRYSIEYSPDKGFYVK